jgi:hypothetical protein
MRAEDRERFLRYAFGDFNRFCGILDIVPKSGIRAKLVLNPIQLAYCLRRTPRDVVLKARQVGLTTYEQARDAYTFLTRRGARVVVTCQSMTDHVPAKLIAGNFRTMFDGLAAAGLSLGIVERAGEWILPGRDSTLRIVEAGASKAAAAKKGRAGVITRLHLTETAFYEYAEETLNALLECVPGTDSEIVSESTPNGASGVFYSQCKEARSGRSGYRFHFFPWYLQPEYRAALAPGERMDPETERERELVRAGVSPEQIKWYRQKVIEKGQTLTDQEYPTDPDTCFLASGRPFFDRAAVSSLIARATPPIYVEQDAALRVWREPQRGSQYLIAVDTAEGLVRTASREDPEASKGDYSTAIVLELGTGQHAATLRAHVPSWELARQIAALGYTYNAALLVVERNNHGHAVLQALRNEQHYPRVYVGRDDKTGWLTTPASRPMALDALEDAVRRGVWATNDRLLLGEMLTFVVTAQGRPEAQKGAHDDLVMAAAIGWDVLSRPTAYRDWGGLPVA